jgi:phosphatidylserine/phosphatidylglycerophosphate/cardiolipin synthase-like enzyme
MWKGTFGKGEKTKNPIVKLNLENKTQKKETIKLISLFCPDDLCSENIADIIEKANNSIYFMEFSFTDQIIANAIVNRYNNDITVSGVIEKNQANVAGSRFEFLKYQDIDVSYDNNKYFMHHKVIIIDKKIVVTGSMNPTSAGNLRNDENVLIIYDKDIAEKYLEEFERIRK